jgi:hypothetical protein
MSEKKRRRLGDRKEGYKIRTISPMLYVTPYIMKRRSDALNYFSDTIDMAAIDKYIREKKSEGMTNFGMLHVLLAGYVRMVAIRPGINRFVSGQRIYHRHKIEVVMTIKKEMTLNSPDTVIKVQFEPTDTAKDVYEKFNAKVLENQTPSSDSNFDKTANLLHYIPNIFLRGAIRFINFLDYHGWLPQFLLDVSPFHGSMIITSMGSLGIQPIYHHIYDFGNLPIFISYGAKYYKNELDENGEVQRHCYVDLKVVTDERICDGYYYASAFKHLKKLMKNPSALDEPPKVVVEDID